MIKIIKKLISYKRKAKLITRLFQENSPFMKNGIYYFDRNLKLIYRNDASTIKYIQNVLKPGNYHFLKNKSIQQFIKKIIVQSKLYVQNGDNDAEGTIFLVSNTSSELKDIKIFYLDSNEIVTQYSNKKAYAKKIETYNAFMQYFPIPEILFFDNEKLLVIETLVNAKPKNNWMSSDYFYVSSRIFETYYNYLSQICIKEKIITVSMKTYIQFLSKKEKFLCLIDPLKELVIEEYISDKFPKIKLHGDLWLYNIIFENSADRRLFFIDWEHSGEYVFFYDLFWFMFNEAVYDNNFSYLANYFNGFYDNEFKSIFNYLNIKFDTNKRCLYFSIFFFEMLIERVLLSENEIIISAIDLFSPIIEKIYRINRRKYIDG